MGAPSISSDLRTVCEPLSVVDTVRATSVRSGNGDVSRAGVLFAGGWVSMVVRGSAVRPDVARVGGRAGNWCLVFLEVLDLSVVLDLAIVRMRGMCKHNEFGVLYRRLRIFKKRRVCACVGK